VRLLIEALTIESKHWVQSSLYTDCVDPGARSSELFKSTDLEANAGCLPGALTCMQAMVGCRQSGALHV
jgi:hypothetical protein